jgi:UDP-N-acetylglucosamine 2-epimerase
MTKTIALFCSSRKQYGLFSRIITEIDLRDDIEYQLIIAGSSFNNDINRTLSDIKLDNFEASCTINIPEINDHYRINSVCSKVFSELGKALTLLKPDYFLVNDFTITNLSAAQCAFYYQIPVIHIDNTHPVFLNSYELKLYRGIKSVSSQTFLNFDPDPDKSGISFDYLLTGTPEIDLCKDILNEPHYQERYLENIVKDSTYLIFQIKPAYTDISYTLEIIHSNLNTLIKTDYKIIVLYPSSLPYSNKVVEAFTSYKTASNIVFIESTTYRDHLKLLSGSAGYISNTYNSPLETYLLSKPLIYPVTMEGSEKSWPNIIRAHKAYPLAKALEAIQQPTKTLSIPGLEGTPSRRILQELLSTGS